MATEKTVISLPPGLIEELRTLDPHINVSNVCARALAAHRDSLPYFKVILNTTCLGCGSIQTETQMIRQVIWNTKHTETYIEAFLAPGCEDDMLFPFNHEACPFCGSIEKQVSLTLRDHNRY